MLNCCIKSAWKFPRFYVFFSNLFSRKWTSNSHLSLINYFYKISWKRRVFNRIVLPLWCKCWIAVTAASNRLENFLVWFVGVCCNAADGGTFSKVSFVAIVSSVESKVFRVKFDKNSILSRVFLQLQIWIVNYYVRKSVRKSQ